MHYYIDKAHVSYEGGCMYQIYTPDMHVPVRVVAPEHQIEQLITDKAIAHMTHIAQLPGIQDSVWAMPNVHTAHGFPSGTVAATDIHENGIISPAGIGYDINCGVRMLTTNIPADIGDDTLAAITKALQNTILSGSNTSQSITLNRHDLKRVLTHGPQELVAWGYGTEDDVTYCEEHAQLAAADPNHVPQSAIERAHGQLDTLGSGSHFIEIQEITDVYDEETAAQFGIERGMLTIMIHTGSRGVGHEVTSEYMTRMHDMASHDDNTYDPARAYAPFTSELGQAYYAAMSAAAHFAWANRHMLGHHVRTALTDICGPQTEVRPVYDITHNLGHREQHRIHGRDRDVFVHRKGATRAFSPRYQNMPNHYQATGHPVIVPGTMGTASFVMVGRDDNRAFGSCCHGAGRTMSRTHARTTLDARRVKKTLDDFNISVISGSDDRLVEETPQAYQDIASIVNTVSCAHLAKPVARMVPRIVIKA